MSQGNDQIGSHPTGSQRWLEVWNQWVEERQEYWRKTTTSSPPSENLSSLRKQWLENLGKSLDEYLRSRGFLEVMSQVLRDEKHLLQNRMLTLSEIKERTFQARVGITPHDVAYESGGLKLLNYRGVRPRAFREPLLICYALVNRPYILDLQPGRSVVEQFVRCGFDVYLVDWGVPTATDRTMRMNDYVGGHLKKIVDIVSQRSGEPQINLMGYCMGGTLSALFTACYPKLIRNLALMAAPIDFGGDESLLHLWTRVEHFDVDRLIDTHGNCPAILLQTSFQLMKPVHSFIEKYTILAENQHDEKFLETYFAMEKWTTDSIPVAGETFREFVKCFYQRNQLVKGEFELDGKLARLDQISCPLLLLTADLDHLVLPKSTLGILPHVRSSDVRHMSIAAGHVGLAVSSKAHRQLWPKVTEWFAQRSTAMPAQ